MADYQHGWEDLEGPQRISQISTQLCMLLRTSFNFYGMDLKLLIYNLTKIGSFAWELQKGAHQRRLYRI